MINKRNENTQNYMPVKINKFFVKAYCIIGIILIAILIYKNVGLLVGVIIFVDVIIVDNYGLNCIGLFVAVSLVEVFIILYKNRLLKFFRTISGAFIIVSIQIIIWLIFIAAMSYLDDLFGIFVVAPILLIYLVVGGAFLLPLFVRKLHKVNTC